MQLKCPFTPVYFNVYSFLNTFILNTTKRNGPKWLYKGLAQVIMEPEKSHDLCLQVGDLEIPVVWFESQTVREPMVEISVEV